MAYDRPVMVEPRLARLTMEAYLAADLSAEINEPVDLPLTKEMAERAFVASVRVSGRSGLPTTFP